MDKPSPILHQANVIQQDVTPFFFFTYRQISLSKLTVECRLTIEFSDGVYTVRWNELLDDALTSRSCFFREILDSALELAHEVCFASENTHRHLSLEVLIPSAYGAGIDERENVFKFRFHWDRTA